MVESCGMCGRSLSISKKRIKSNSKSSTLCMEQNILDDEEAVQVLQKSKSLSKEIEEKYAASVSIEQKITETKVSFEPIAKHSSVPVSYTHLTLPTKRIVQISVVAVPLKKKAQIRISEQSIVNPTAYRSQ
eukprot:TRINITY_DN2119_c0_g1_i7.p3 TRINITY_DN2119_c0_g1~~TRINITY_DN2119_c0_g1_i7.p3  ORF type:complete len:131 (+),score=20.64 TRINITY_DN2119_c0_g1_i7:230-622(+)